MGIIHSRREEKRKEAELRNAKYATLSFEEKLARQIPDGKVARKLKRQAEAAVRKSK